jgi:transcriptional regulator with XRE-family HTH domain
MPPESRLMKTQPKPSETVPGGAGGEIDQARLRQFSAADFEQLGSRLRHTRRLRKLRLADVARLVPCSESLLSKIETNRVSPSLHTLHRIAAVLDTTVAELFSPEGASGATVFREGERPIVRLESSGGEAKLALERLIPFTRGRILNANVHVIPPGAGNGGDLKHEGEEVGYVLSGRLELTVRGETRVLDEGDSFFFLSHLPHSYRNPGDRPARILWVNSPPF